MNIQKALTHLAPVLVAIVVLSGCLEPPSYDPCNFHPENQKLCDSGIEGSNNNCVTEDHPHCPSGVCLSYQYSEAFCSEQCTLPICSTDEDCAGGEKCIEGPTFKTCAKACAAAEDCGAGLTCDLNLGYCVSEDASVCERLGWDPAGCPVNGCCVRISVAGEAAEDGFCVQQDTLSCQVEPGLIGVANAENYEKTVTDACYQSDCRAGACCRTLGVGCTDPTDPSTCVHGCVKDE